MNLKEIKGRIKAVKKTGSITKAMQNIALSKLKGATDIHEHAQAYDRAFKTLQHIVLKHLDEGSPYLGDSRGQSKLYVLIASDRGLAGPYHNHLFKALEQQLNPLKDVILPIGKKSFQFVEKKTYNNVITSPVLNRDNIMTFDYFELSRLIIGLFDQEAFDEVYVVFNEHKSITEHTSVIKKILPIDVNDIQLEDTHVFEQSSSKLAQAMLPMYVQSQLLLSLANGKLSEHASRMIAMKNATDNAEDIASKLQVQYHRARQQAITEELIDVINGSNV